MKSEALRTIHHFACTGGTLISKCIAATPNTLLLSELDPLSPLSPLHKATDIPEFSPSDIISLLKSNHRPICDDLIIEIFNAGLKVLYKYCISHALYLVVRDHAHSQYCVDRDIKNRKILLDMLSSEFDTISIVTVRHPLDSYLSLINNNWEHFSPKGIDEYCNRYIKFMHDHERLEIFKYENFVHYPEKEMMRMCEDLCLPYNDKFIEIMPAIKLTGDSGRASENISERRRREAPVKIKEDILKSESYAKLCALLGYEK